MTNPNEEPAGLAAAMHAHGIELPPAHVEQLDRYCRLLWDWNTRLNLTRHTDSDKFVARDLVDSLAFTQFLAEGERILDVGTGGGVPGIVVAIVRPDINVSLSESVGKRARVVAEIVEQLGLKVEVHAVRAEELLGKLEFDSLLVRAVAPLPKLLRWFRPHWSHFRRLLVLKGPAWVEERGEARHLGLLKGLALRKLTSYPLAGTKAESVLLQISPASGESHQGKTRQPPGGR